MNNPFCTYHDNGNYADLSNYGRPELIMTKDAVLKNRRYNKYTDRYEDLIIYSKVKK